MKTEFIAILWELRPTAFTGSHDKKENFTTFKHEDRLIEFNNGIWWHFKSEWPQEVGVIWAGNSSPSIVYKSSRRSWPGVQFTLTAGGVLALSWLCRREMALYRRLPSGICFNGSEIIVCGFILLMWVVHVSYGFLMPVAFAPIWRFFVMFKERPAISDSDLLSVLSITFSISTCLSFIHLKGFHVTVI